MPDSHARPPAGPGRSGQSDLPAGRWEARRFRAIRAFGRYLLNPSMRRLVELGVVGDNLVCELETTGRQTGRLRRVPVSPMFDEHGAWVVCGHGTRSGWGANIAADPRVRLKRGRVWRSGTARFVPEDDIEQRLAAHKGIGPKIAAKGTRPVSVRIDFDSR